MAFHVFKTFASPVMLQSLSVLLAGQFLQRYESMRQDPVWVPVIARLQTAPPANRPKLQKHMKTHCEVVADFKSGLARLLARSTNWLPVTTMRYLQACLSPFVRLQALQTSCFSTTNIFACVMLLFTCTAIGPSY